MRSRLLATKTAAFAGLTANEPLYNCALGIAMWVSRFWLMTRGTTMTFSLANDVGKNFAIIPTAFASTYPVLNRLNVMNLASPSSAILSAVMVSV